MRSMPASPMMMAGFHERAAGAGCGGAFFTGARFLVFAFVMGMLLDSIANRR